MKYPINIPNLYKEDRTYAKQAIDTGWISSAGPMVKQFEDEFSDWVNRRYGCTMSNGSSALVAAVHSLNLPKGSEIILPSTTIVSCYNAIVQNGMKPVFADVELDTWNISADSIISKVTSNTKAVMVVDLYGNMVDTERIKNVAEMFKLKIIEDAAEAHGAYDSKYVAGQFGDVSTFSFYSNKIITTGEGGILVTDDEEIFERASNFKNLCFEDRKSYTHSGVGYNFRMTNVQAGLGLGQLENVEKTIKERRRVAERYNSNLMQFNNITLPTEKIDTRNVYWYYSILIEDDKDNFQLRDKVATRLEENGIDYRFFFKPLHLQPFINEKEKFKNSEYIYETGINLPTYSTLRNDDIDWICSKIKEVLGGN